MVTTVSRRVAGARLSTAAALPLLAGCTFMGDPPPAPEVQPLEVVVGSQMRPENPCILNVRQVGAGTHDVIVISESAQATVRILDGAGVVVFETEEAQPNPQMAGEQEVRALEAGPDRRVRLESGSYSVECAPVDGRVSRTTLRVVPARPGFEDATAGP